MTRADFGRTAGGERVEAVTIGADGLSAEILTFGATIRSLTPTGAKGARNVVLSLDTLADYEAHKGYFGAIAGRCANRIRAGRFHFQGRTIALDLNEGGRTHLHGGSKGFATRVWTVAAADARSVTLTLRSEDGDQGYPGAVDVTCRYTVGDDRSLSIDLSATTDAPTIVNLATHAYFNLDGGESVLDHRLRIPAETYTPVDADLIPSGELRPVTGTPFDFRTLRPIRHLVNGSHVGYDHNFVVRAERSPNLRPVALLEGPASGLALAILSTEPGLQVYDGIYLGGLPVPLAGGRRAARHGAVCLEPQAFPDAVNHPNFPSVALRPGEIYRQTTVYRFTG